MLNQIVHGLTSYIQIFLLNVSGASASALKI